jgi:hypothetical protein
MNSDHICTQEGAHRPRPTRPSPMGEPDTQKTRTPAVPAVGCLLIPLLVLIGVPALVGVWSGDARWLRTAAVLYLLTLLAFVCTAMAALIEGGRR